MRSKRSVVWVVEVWKDYRKRWAPTVKIGLTKYDARRTRKELKTLNPEYKFHVSKYVREEKP